MSESAKRDLTPEQRAKLAAALAKSAAAGPRAFTTKTCLRAEDLKKGTLRIGGDDDEAERCRYQVTVQTKTQQEATATCTGDPPRTSKIKAQSLDREHITGTIESTSGASQSTVRFTGRWVGTDCSGADDE